MMMISQCFGKWYVHVDNCETKASALKRENYFLIVSFDASTGSSTASPEADTATETSSGLSTRVLVELLVESLLPLPASGTDVAVFCGSSVVFDFNFCKTDW